MVRQGITMAERIARVEERTLAIPRIESKLDKFIDSVDAKYATKDELRSVAKTLQQKNQEQDQAIGWNREKVVEVIYRVSVVTGMTAILTKYLGLW